MDTQTLLHISAIAAAGFGAGFINVIVGSGTLITFPILLMFGFPALTANMSNSIGLVAGNLSGVWGYRREIAAQKKLALKLLPASIVGGATGALLLLVLPSSVFDLAVPLLILLGIIMVAITPWVQRRTAEKLGTSHPHPALSSTPIAVKRPILTWIVVFLLGVYGGYFGAAQGVLMVGALGMMLAITLQTLNALKNFLCSAVNLLAAFIFISCASELIDWTVVIIIAVGSTLGGLVGAKVGRKLPAPVLRVVIITVGTIALINMLV